MTDTPEMATRFESVTLPVSLITGTVASSVVGPVTESWLLELQLKSLDIDGGDRVGDLLVRLQGPLVVQLRHLAHRLGVLGRHLFRAGEILAARLNTYHNLFYYLSLMAGARAAIGEGRFAQFRREFYAKRQGSGLVDQGPTPAKAI